MQAACVLRAEGGGPRAPPAEGFHVQQAPRGQAVLQPLALNHWHTPLHGHCCLEQWHAPYRSWFYDETSSLAAQMVRNLGL